MRTRRTTFALLASCVIAAVALSGCGSSAAQTTTTAAVVGKTAPVWSLPLASGGTFHSSELKGKAVYLNFFATWCGPCSQEAPYIDALSRAFAKDGVVVIGVDELESSQKALKFKAQHKVTYRIVNDGGLLRDAYSINGLPGHAFIARNGTLKAFRPGEMSRADIAAQLKSIAGS